MPSSTASPLTPNRGPFTPLLPRLVVSVLLSATGVTTLSAANVSIESLCERVGDEIRVTILESHPLSYFKWERSRDLWQPYEPIGMALSSPLPTFSFRPQPGLSQSFFRARAVSLFEAGDADGDGLNDVWELANGLDPLDPADADEPRDGFHPPTNWQYYRDRFHVQKVTEFISDEVSVHNRPFAFSDEVSVFHFPSSTAFSVEALSQEVSVFHLPDTTNIKVEAISDEVSVFVLPSETPLNLAAYSDEVSVFVLPSETPLNLAAYSDEVSVFVLPPETSLNRAAYSDEVSVFVLPLETPLNRAAYSDEVSVQTP